MDGIFISYRRDDAAGYAGRLSDRLKAHFGAERVFMDVEGIEPGTDFVVAIEQAVGSCRVLIVLIGDEWLNIRDAQGHRRLDDPHDFIRLEIGAALKRGIRVVPVVLDRATMPGVEQLPDELKPLARRQAIAVHHQQWEASTATLIQALQKLLGEKPPDDQWHPLRWAVATALGVALLGAGAWWWWPRAALEEEVGLLTAGSSAPPSPATAGAPGDTVALARVPPTPSPAPPPETVVALAPVPVPHAATAGAARAPLPAAVPPVGRTPPQPTPAAPRAATPAPAPPVARAPEAVPAARTPDPAAPVARASDPRLPAVGQSWTYRLRGKWPTSPNRTVVIRVHQVSGEMVVDSLLDDAAAPVQRSSRVGQGGFVSWPGIGAEFSPYLVAGEIESWSGRGFTTPDVDGHWTQWHSEGQALGREAVNVPAGRFDAIKVEVWSNRMATGGAASAQLEPVRVHYLVWYAPQVKRYVRLQRRVMSAAGQEVERDVFELVSHEGG